jgi:hypothetical protein
MMETGSGELSSRDWHLLSRDHGTLVKESTMEDKAFDGFTRAMSQMMSRRATGALAVGIAAWLGAEDDGEAKRKKKKHKKQKCNRCGAACCAAGEVCIVRGTAGEQCVPEIRTCTADDNNCRETTTGGLWCNYANDCDCYVTTAGAVACLGPTASTSCGNCTVDADCTAAYGPGSACVQAGPGCTQTGCTRGFCKAACPV